MVNGISVIICCHNSASRIPKVLEKLAVQKNTESISWEIVVVDNASTDDTANAALSAWRGKKHILKVIYEQKPGLSFARMAGLGESKYDIINFIDDDNLVTENWISHVFELMSKNDAIGMLGGLGIPKSDVELPEWFGKFKEAYAVGPQEKATGFVSFKRMYLHGAGISIRRKIWDLLDNKGFKFQLTGRKGKGLSSGEDYELSCAVRMLGYNLYYDEKLVFEHLIPKTRLSIFYLRRLFKAFGVASNYTFLYRTYLLGNKFPDRIKYSCWLTSLFYSFYMVMRHKLFASSTTTEIDDVRVIDLKFQYWKSNLIFKLKNAFNFIRVKQKIIKFARNCQYE